MKIRFWGVRGSLPRPLTSGQVKEKISAVLQIVRPEDLKDQESRERFLARLSPSLFGTVGGNTTCVEFRTSDNKMILFDAGSGLQRLGSVLAQEREVVKEFHIFFTHFHWDHLQGLPFFPKLYDPSVTIHFYSPKDNIEEVLRGQMREPYFPITLDAANARLLYHKLEKPVKVGNAEVRWKQMSHPGESRSYPGT